MDSCSIFGGSSPPLSIVVFTKGGFGGKIRFLYFIYNMVTEFKQIGAGLATIALSGVGVGIGIIFGNLLDSVSRNPSIAKLLFNYAILGFALTEAIALFTIMIVFLLMA
jgi:F-type H+-transporting ATPase subunit c